MLIIEILFLFIVIISNYIVGNLALNFVSLGNLRKYEKQFFAQLLGIIITVTLYAIAKNRVQYHIHIDTYYISSSNKATKV